MLRVSRGKEEEKEPRQVLLWSRDVEIKARELVRLYRARFQIEFLFRDAKSGAGLTQCQSRKPEVLAFHWNAAFAAINVAKAHRKNPQPARFSWASLQQKQTNLQLLQLFSSQLQLDGDVVKLHPNFQTVCNYGVIAT